MYIFIAVYKRFFLILKRFNYYTIVWGRTLKKKELKKMLELLSENIVIRNKQIIIIIS